MSAFDLSSGAFNAAQHYSAVSMQQGRVQLDADSNEDSEANSEKIRRLTADAAIRAADLVLPNAITPVTPADPAPTGDSTLSTMASALARCGGLHPLASESRVTALLRASVPDA